jgi:NhaA family Na+:H+ antiporter
MLVSLLDMFMEQKEMNYLQRFFRSDAASGVLLIIAAVLAMGMANFSVTRDAYFSFLNLPVVLQIGDLAIHKNMLLWINDALMAAFFLLVGLEVKRELCIGTLAGRHKAALPAIAALGGMIMPALIYLLFNGADPTMRAGWAIPTATDIAFALGVLALLGSRVPLALKVFLMALAIIDDLGAILIIALFYTHQLSLFSLGIAAVAIAVMVIMNVLNVRRVGLYLLVGVVLWTAVLKSGVHATLAGVIIGFLIPLEKERGYSPSEELEHTLQPWVAFLILPLFAFANAGVSLQGVTATGLLSFLPVGIIAGLLIGKPLGVGLFCWLGLKLRVISLPEGMRLGDILAVGVLCGIGFTMSIFITSLAFSDMEPEWVGLAKLGILIGSLLSAMLGYYMLRARFSVST